MAYPQESFIQTRFDANSFWESRRTVVRKNTLLYQLDMLKKTGRYDAFRLKWHPIYDDKELLNWPVPKHLFWDSDVAKWIEGACYFLDEAPDTEIDAAVRELVDLIGKAQQEDGYLNIHFTVVRPTERFTNVRDLHELYNAGHLIEAACIHHLHYKNNLLLDPIKKYVQLLSSTFGPGPTQIHGYPGHPEIELALLRVYSITHDETHLDLARYFITERGSPTGADGRHFFTVESEKRGEREMERPDYTPQSKSYWYQQAHKPIIEQDSVEGHSVRAMYLYTAVADLARLDQNYGSDASRKQSSSDCFQALLRLWDNMTGKKMYLTGGIGAMKQWEGFGIDYFLPQGTDDGGCYAETCASIGVMMLAERLLQLDLDGRYADIMERCMYNAVLTAMSADGKSFTYVNQLASSSTHLSKREEWFECACCPPNMTRTMGILGGYLWTHGIDTAQTAAFINVHQYTSATLTFPAGSAAIQLKQESEWPWKGDVKFSLKSHIPVSIRLRIPRWAEGFKVEPECPGASLTKGYLILSESFLSQNQVFSLHVDGFTPRFIRPHPYCSQDIVAIARGPIVYCVEDIDNLWVTNHFKDVAIDPNAALEEVSMLGIEDGFVAISAPGAGILINPSSWDLLSQKSDGETDAATRKQIRKDLNFVPYYARANRGGSGQMRVGLRISRE